MFGTCQTILICNYFDVPKITEDHSYIYGVNQYSNLVKQDFNYNICFTDKVISNLEMILIYIPMLWGIMRLVDLAFFLEKYKKDE